MKFISWIGSVIIFLAVAHPASAQLSVQMKQAAGTARTEVMVDITYINSGAVALSIPERGLPRVLQDGRLWNDSFLVVSQDGDAAAYRGIIAHLSAAAREKALTLEPGQRLVRQVNLSLNYELRAGQTYRVSAPVLRYRSLGGTEAAGATAIEEAITAPVSMLIVAPLPRAGQSAETAPQDASRAASCTPARLKDLAAGIAAAAGIARSSKNYLESLYGYEVGESSIIVTFKETARYRSWFGEHGDPNIANPVNGRIRKTVSGVATRFALLRPPSCDCPEEMVGDTNAWISTAIPYVVNYCPRFFDLPVGPNVPSGSKAATIYHEVTHFADTYALATTDLDEQFPSPEDARYVARTARDLASEHAYGYEYFADNHGNEN